MNTRARVGSGTQNSPTAVVIRWSETLNLESRINLTGGLGRLMPRAPLLFTVLGAFCTVLVDLYAQSQASWLVVALGTLGLRISGARVPASAPAHCPCDCRGGRAVS
jgi:hypothetical protein